MARHTEAWPAQDSEDGACRARRRRPSHAVVALVRAAADMLVYLAVMAVLTVGMLWLLWTVSGV